MYLNETPVVSNNDREIIYFLKKTFFWVVKKREDFSRFAAT